MLGAYYVECRNNTPFMNTWKWVHHRLNHNRRPHSSEPRVQSRSLTTNVFTADKFSDRPSPINLVNVMTPLQVSHSEVYHIQAQRDDREVGRPNTRAIRPLPKQAQFGAVRKRGERYS